MESPNAAEKPSLDPIGRSPLTEFLNGFGIFLLVLVVFMGAQSYFLVRHAAGSSPEFAGRGLSMELLNDPAFQERLTDLTDDGDTVSLVSLWSGLLGLATLMGFCWWWKRERIINFLGLRPPALKPLAAWIGLFVLVITAIELITLLLPEFDNSFMENVLASARNKPLLFMGAAIMPAIFEEFFLRGLLYGSLRHVLDKHTAIAIASGVFTIIHVQYPWYLLALYILPLAVLLGYARANTGSIWTAVVLHLINNTVSLALPQLP